MTALYRDFTEPFPGPDVGFTGGSPASRYPELVNSDRHPLQPAARQGRGLPKGGSVMTNHRGLECELCKARTACFFADAKGATDPEVREARTTNVYRRRQTVFYEGSAPHGVFVVCAGRVKIYKSDGRGHQLTVRIAGPGAILGHEDLLAGTAYSVTAESLEDSTLAYVDEAKFRAAVLKSPALSARMFVQLAGEIRAAEDKARDLATKTSRERLAAELLTVRNTARPVAKPSAAAKPAAPAVRLPYTRQDLADLAGLAQETAIRLLTELESQKVIVLQGRDLTVVNPGALEKLAGATV